MKIKVKKRYFVYLLLILFVIFLVWVFRHSAMADTCSTTLNDCLLASKEKDFFPRMLAGLSCTIKNLGCLIIRMF